MIYLLDTDTLIFLIRGLRSHREKERTRASNIVENCRKAQRARASVALSAITICELEFGARKSGNYDIEIGAVRKVLAPFDIYDYDSTASPQSYGLVRRELEIRGLPIGSMDLLIAAHALALDATLVSNNTGHFSRVAGLKLVSWLSE